MFRGWTSINMALLTELSQSRKPAKTAKNPTNTSSLPLMVCGEDWEGGTVLLRYCYGIYPEDAATKCSFLTT